ncbi:hypothetical protein J3A83DRAFT_1130268 [Scleroderma citrinum]
MGNIEGWLLERDCISLPVLRTLNLCLTKARHFMEAIIAPRLEYFDYSSDSPDSIEFGVLRNKFSTVHHLSLLRQENANCGMALCEALPGIRCVEGYPLGDFHSLKLLTIDLSRRELTLDESRRGRLRVRLANFYHDSKHCEKNLPPCTTDFANAASWS